MKLVDIDIGLRSETEKAICVSQTGSDAIWLPKSQVEFQKQRGGTYIVTLPEWLAMEKGLI